MIAGDDRIELPGDGAAEHRVGGNGPGDVDAIGAAALEHRGEDLALFLADQPALAGVGIQAGQHQPRPGHPEAGKLGMREPDGRLQTLRRQHRRYVGERNVHGRQHHRQALGVEHHPDLAGAGQLREQLGMSAPAQPGARPRLLVDGSGGQAVDAFRQRIPRGPHDDLVRGAAGRRGHDPRLKSAGDERLVENGLADLAHGRVRRRFRGHFRPDAGRIAGGDSDAGQMHANRPTGAYSPPQPAQPPEPQPPLLPPPQEPVRLQDPSWAQPANCSPAAFGSS